MSVTLSVNAPTGQTPLRIFTVDSLADADLRKDVPFGGLDDEYLHLGVQSPQNPHFGGLNRHFKPKYAKNSCFFNIHGDSCLSCPFQAPNFLCTVIVP